MPKVAALIDQRLLPKKFGKFELREQIGQGGFGTVYLAQDTELGRQVAVKIPHRRALLTVGESGKVLRSSYDVDRAIGHVDRFSLAEQLGVSSDALTLQPLAGNIEKSRLLAATGGSLAIIGLDKSEASRLFFPMDGRTWECAVLASDAGYLIGCGVDAEHANAVLRKVDLQTGDYRDLCHLPSVIRVGDLALSPDGSLVAVTTQMSDDGHKRVQVLETATGRLLYDLPAAFDSRVQFVLSGQKMIFMRQREIVLFDLQTGRDDVLVDAHQHSQHLLTLSADEKLLATADQGREIKLWSLPECKELATLVGHVGQLTDLRFSADGRTLFSASVDGSIKAWSVASGRFVMNLRDQQQPGVSWLRLDSEERKLVYGGTDGAVRQLVLKR